MRKAIVAVVLSLALAGCGNAFSGAYNGKSADELRRDATWMTCREPVFIAANDLAKARAELEKQGYAYIGGSSVELTAGDYSPELEKEQARELGACVVLSSKRFIGSRTHTTPRYATHGGTSTRFMGKTVKYSNVPNSYYVEGANTSPDALWSFDNALYVKKRGTSYKPLTQTDFTAR